MKAIPSKTKPIFAIVGKDGFLRSENLAAVLREIDPDQDAIGPSRIEGDRATLAAVLDEIRTPSLLGGRRIVIVDAADEFISENRAGLERYCSNLGEGILVLLCDSLPKNTRLYKSISEVGKIIACDPPRGRDVVTWIVSRSQTAYGKKCNSEVARLLARELGDSLGVLDSELSKLATFVGDRPGIEEGDVFALSGQTRPELVFAVTDALCDRDVRTALNRWHQVLATDRAAPERAVGGLAWGLRRLCEARREYDRGASVHSLSGRMRMDEAILRKRLELTTVARLALQQRDLLAADLASKTGAATIETAVERLIVRHCVTDAKAN